MALRMRQVILLCLYAGSLGGCMQQDENPDWNPRADYPAWTYDAPFYYRPSVDLEPVEFVGKGIGVHYVRSDFFFIRHPGGYQLTGTPRVAVWFSTDEGQTWEKAGHFGVDQTHFLFQAENDARYWVRFVGPGQRKAKGPVPLPHRIYVVDREAPILALAVRPKPQDAEKKPHIYKVGDEISLGWAVQDANLKAESVKLESCIGKEPYELAWGRFRGALPESGRRVITIPAEAAREGKIRFRIEAADKAGNLAEVITPPLLVAPTDKPATRPAPPLPEQFVGIGPLEGAVDKRPGWPRKGSMLRGGTKVRLDWMPDAARQYKNIRLQLSTNNTLTWKTVATNLVAGEPVEWTVPRVSSRFCRLRLIAVGEGNERILLAQSAMFRIVTIVDDVKVGPDKLPVIRE